MKKFLNSVAGRYTIFGLCLFLIAIGFSQIEALFRIQVEFSDTQISISSNRYNMAVTYEQIESVKLVDMPDRGEVIDGGDDSSIRYGKWTNDTWGDYSVVAIPHATNCVVIHLTDGRTFVFNTVNNDETAAAYETLLGNLNSNGD